MAQLNDFIMGRAGAGKNVALAVVFIPSTNLLFLRYLRLWKFSHRKAHGGALEGNSVTGRCWY